MMMKKIVAALVLIGMILISASAWFTGSAGTNTEQTAFQVGTCADFQPMAFVRDGQIVGFDIDLMTEAARRLGKTVTWVDEPFEALLSELQTARIQVVAAGLSYTPERAKRVLFTQPYLVGDPLLVISNRAGSHALSITSLDGLKGKRVVVNDGYTADQYMSKLEGPIIVRLGTVAEAFLALETGKAEAFVTARSTVEPYFKQHDRQAFNLFVIEGTSENYVLAVAPAFPQLREELQDVLNAMTADGTIAQLKQKWEIPDDRILE